MLCGAVRLMLFATFAAQVCLTLSGFEAAYLIWGMFASRFTVADAQATGVVLAYLCLGLTGWAAQSMISRGFYALGSTWLPTIVGTAVAFAAVPLYVVLRRHWGENGLAVASSIAILVYVLLLGFLQRRRFEREAAAAGGTLDDIPGMMNAALRLALAAAVAIAVGLALRTALLAALPGVGFLPVLVRATVLCAVGGGLYLAPAWLLGVREFERFERMLLRRVRWRRRGAAGSV